MPEAYTKLNKAFVTYLGMFLCSMDCPWHDIGEIVGLGPDRLNRLNRLNWFTEGAGGDGKGKRERVQGLGSS